MSLNVIRFNSKLSFFSNIDCLKVDIQFQKFLKIVKLPITKVLYLTQKKFLWLCMNKKMISGLPRFTGHRCKVCQVEP